MHLVIILHGLCQTGQSLRRLNNHFLSNSLDTLNISYPSTKMKIEEIVEFIDPIIKQKISEKNYQKISFVGFSMGGIVIRAYLKKYKIDKLCNVLFIGTPNKGSEVASFISKYKIFQYRYGEAISELAKNSKLIKNLGEPDFNYGIIAGNMPLDICFFLILGKPNDGKVSVDSCRINKKKEKEFVCLKLPHWYLPKSKVVLQKSLDFILNSNFLN